MKFDFRILLFIYPKSIQLITYSCLRKFLLNRSSLLKKKIEKHEDLSLSKVVPAT